MSRVNIHEIQPDAYKAMFGLEGYLVTCNISPLLAELVRIKASQINGCAFCIQMHTQAALKHGEKSERLFALGAWKESPLFSDEERVVLALTEEVTNISAGGVSDETYANVSEFFGEKQMAQLIMLIATINTWNRIAVTTHAQ